MSSVDAIIIGSGAWGRSLAHTLLFNKKKVLIYSRDEKHLDLNATNKNLTKTTKFSDIKNYNAPVVIATPVSSLRNIGELFVKNEVSTNIILACKGIESRTGLFPTEVMQEFIKKDNLAILSGPSFAHEVIKNKPTAVTIASENNETLDIFIKLFHSKFFRVYASNDVIGCQLGGAMKNILAVAVGISDGLGLGPNAKAALITRGIIEIRNLGKILKCDDITIFGLSGLGDLVLTSNDNLSRNRRFGLEIAKGFSVKDSQKNINQVIESISAAEGLQLLIKRYSLSLPICSKVFDIINEKCKPEDAVNDLLIREQKKEFI